jgi:hypothetical protein
MRKRLEPIVLEKAIETIPGFSVVYQKLQQQVTFRVQSKSTLENYIRHIAQIDLHDGKLTEQINETL